MKKSILLFAATLFAAATFAQTPTVSASSVTFKYCETKDAVLTVYTLLPYTWRAQDLVVDLDEYGTTVYTLVNARGCDSIVSLTLKDPSLPGEFTVDANGTKVRFSKGNLQYRASLNGVAGDLVHNVRGGGTRQGEWRFADNQWSENTSNEIGETSTQWIDVFTYGSSGYTTARGQSRYASPYDAAYTNNNCGQTIDNTDYEWGHYNDITNGGPANCGWFTLTKEQWSYIFDGRFDSQTERRAHCTKGTVNGIKGIIVLPDNWQLPENCTFQHVYNSFTNTNCKYVDNATNNDWKKMEAAGAVFFPIQTTDSYWTSSSNGNAYRWYPHYYQSNDDYFGYTKNESGNYTYHVRLVRKVQ